MAIEIDTSAALIQRQRQRTRFTVVSVLFSSCAKAASYESRSEASAAIVMKTQVHAANEVSLSSLRRQLEVSRGEVTRERESERCMPIDRSIDEVREAGGRQATVSLSRALALSVYQVRLSRSLADSTHAQPTNTATTVWTSLDLCGPLWRSPAASERQLARHNTKSSLLFYHPKPIISLPSKSKAHHLSTVQISLPRRLLCSP